MELFSTIEDRSWRDLDDFILLNLNKNQGTRGYFIGDQEALWGYRVEDVAVGLLIQIQQ